ARKLRQCELETKRTAILQACVESKDLCSGALIQRGVLARQHFTQDLLSGPPDRSCHEPVRNQTLVADDLEFWLGDVFTSKRCRGRGVCTHADYGRHLAKKVTAPGNAGRGNEREHADDGQCRVDDLLMFSERTKRVESHYESPTWVNSSN